MFIESANASRGFRLPTKITVSLSTRSFHISLVLLLFTWYVLYPGISGFIPFYDSFDEAIFVTMLGLALIKLPQKPGKIPLNPWAFWILLSLFVVITASTLFFQSSWQDVLKYSYLIFRPFILLVYITAYCLPGDRIFDHIVKISWIFLIVNLPAILYNLVRINVRVILPEYHDTVAGFFPFQNNDGLVGLYAILILHEAYKVLIARQTSRIFILAGLIVLLLSSMNNKYILMVMGVLLLLTIANSKHRVRNIVLMGVISIIPFILFLGYIQPQLWRITLSPVYIAAEMILEEQVSEHHLLIGTGPGNFTSPIAFDQRKELTEKYGLLELKRYWDEEYQGPTGTLTRHTSSALTLLGDLGIPAVLLYITFLTWGILRNFRRRNLSYIHILGFTFGAYALGIGMLMDTWFWGLEVFLLILSMTRHQASLRQGF
jgi:hypothetical protein